METFSDSQLRQHLKGMENHLLDSLFELISIPSVIEEGGPFPFGENIDKTLRKTLQLCEAMGFDVYYDPEGYYGYAEIGDGEDMLGVLGHLDVVPAGALDDWDHDPFAPIIADGKLYGRGTQDDKGPLLASLYAAYALIRMGIPFRKRLRFIFGTDEETLWRCMKKYIEKEELPSFGFTPDSRFPLIYAEKGLLQIQLKGKNESSLRLKGGSSFNSVPDHIIYAGEMMETVMNKLDELGYPYVWMDNGVKVLGKAAHSQVTEQGINAIVRLAIALKEIGTESKSLHFLADQIKEDPFATTIFGICEDEVSGQLKFNAGMINMNETMEELSIDIRIPVTVSKEQVMEKLQRSAEKYGLSLQVHDWLKPIYIPREHFLVKVLMQVYQEATNDFQTEPIASGGATYARALDNCIAFGALFPHRPKLAHQPNEHIVLEDLFRAMEIYAKAIYRLTR